MRLQIINMRPNYKHEITNSLSSSLSDKQTDLSDKSEFSHYKHVPKYQTCTKVPEFSHYKHVPNYKVPNMFQTCTKVPEFSHYKHVPNYKHEITNSLSSSLSDKQTDLSDKSEFSHYSSLLNDQGQGHDLVSSSQQCKEQLKDPGNLPLLERAFD